MRETGVLGQDFFLNDIDVDHSDYADDGENVFDSDDYDSLIVEFVLELREKFNATTQPLALLQKIFTIC